MDLAELPGEQIPPVVTSTVGTPLVEYKRAFRVVLEVLPFVGLLDKGAELHCMGAYDLAQILGHREAVIPCKNRIGPRRPELPLAPTDDREWRVLALPAKSLV